MDEKQKQIAKHIQSILTLLGEDVERPGLADTPKRYAKAMIELTSGYHQSLHERVNNALFEVESKDLIFVNNITFSSMCEHHLLPFYGSCSICYRPKNKVLGLSKFGRIVDMYAKRLQIQEKFTNEVADAIIDVTHSNDVAVHVSGRHMCMAIRGVLKSEVEMKTNAFRGEFTSNNDSRQLFLMQL